MTCHGTLNDGSSKHGNACRASVFSNCVNAYQSSPDFAVNVSDMSMKTSTPPAAALPLVTPPVRAAAPIGLQPGQHRAKYRPRDLSAGDIQSRFFGAGPTDIFNILQSIDDRLAGRR